MSAETSPFAEVACSATFPAAPGATDYDAIFAAVMETDRGRWFLGEHARRNRQADTAEVLAAIDRLAAMARSALVGPRPDRVPHDPSGADVHRLRIELADMANAITRSHSDRALAEPSVRDRLAASGHAIA